MEKQFKIEKIDLFVSKSPQMVRFYEAVFGMKMKEELSGPFKFYVGKIPGFTQIQFVPEEIAGVDFEQNRHQFNFRVNDLEVIIQDSLANGGAQQGEILKNGNLRTFAVTDPDNNYIVFTGE